MGEEKKPAKDAQLCSEKAVSKVLKARGIKPEDALWKLSRCGTLEKMDDCVDTLFPKCEVKDITNDELKKRASKKNPISVRMEVPGGLHTVNVIGWDGTDFLIDEVDGSKVKMREDFFVGQRHGKVGFECSWRPPIPPKKTEEKSDQIIPALIGAVAAPLITEGIKAAQKKAEAKKLKKIAESKE